MIERLLQKRGNHQGTTLIELLVALLIAGLVMAGVYQVYINSIRTNAVQEQVADAQQNLRVVVDQITRELRLAGYDPSTPGGIEGIQGPLPGFTVSLWAGQTLSLRGDFNSDNLVETLTYAIDNTTDPLHPMLTRQEGGNPPAKFGPNIEEGFFSFFDKNDNATAVPGNVRRVSFSITGRTDKPDSDFTQTPDGYRRRTITGDVVLRNTGGALDTKIPNCPTAVVAVVTNNCRSIRVTWNRPADPDKDLAGYMIFYSQLAINTATTPFIKISDAGPSQPSYLHEFSVPTTGLWNIGVSSYDTSGNLCDNIPANGNPPADTVIASGSPVNVGTANLQPAAPGNAIATPADNQVNLSWGQVTSNIDASPANDLAGFRLYRATLADMSDKILIADETTLTISQIFGGGSSQVTQYVDDDNFSFDASGNPRGPNNCTLYYYQVTVIDRCALESPPATVTSEKKGGVFSPGVTPPDNGMAPFPPTIASLEAGDDTSTLHLQWYNVAGADATHSEPVGYRVYYASCGSDSNCSAPGPWVLWVDVPYDPTAAPYIQNINGLVQNTWYTVRIASYDAVADCNNEAYSTPGKVFTGACAPKIRTHKVVPGISSSGSSVPEDGSAVIGTLSPTTQDRYVTWVADPTDCTPTSANFDAPGFDFNNPPAYNTVAQTAHVQFYLNDPSGPDTQANTRYGTGTTGTNTGNASHLTNAGDHIDWAPRGSDDSYYHFPNDPISTLHIDTGKFCNAQLDFKARAIDGEAFAAERTIPVTVKNGGIEVDPSVTVTSDITTSEDFHHIVRFGIQNTNPILDLKLKKITLEWTNNNAFLDRVEVVASNKVTVLGSWNSATGSPAGLAGIGTELTLNPVPTIQKAGGSDKAYLRLTFKDSLGTITTGADMRRPGTTALETVTIARLEQQDAAASGTTGTCAVTTAGSAAVHKNPAIRPASTVQDQPSLNTATSITPGAIVATTNGTVTVSTKVTPESGFPLGSVKLHYAVTSLSISAAPIRPTAVGGGGNYPSAVVGTYNIITDTWSFPIPGNPNTRIWFYIEAIDGTVTDPFARNFDIYPDQGALTYDQPSNLIINATAKWNDVDAGCLTPDQVVLTGTVTDHLGAPAQGSSVTITMTGPGGPITTNVTASALGAFDYTSPYVWMGDVTVTLTVTKSGFPTKVCTLPAISSCSGSQTISCN